MTGQVKCLDRLIFTQWRQIVDNGSASTWYHEWTKDVNLPGYVVLGMIGYSLNLAAATLYDTYVEQGIVHVGVAFTTNRDPLYSVYVGGNILYVRSSFY